MTDNPITHQVAEQNPDKYKVLSNGAVYSYDDGRIVANPGGGTHAITQANSNELRKTWERQKLEAAIAAQSAVAAQLKRDNALEAWGLIVGEQAELAIDTRKGQTSTKAAEFVGKATGFLGDRRSSDNSGEQVHNTLNVFSDAFIAAIIDKYREQEQEVE